MTDDRQRVAVSVSDTGCGIPDEDLQYVFDRFYKARHAEGGTSQGAGLGLAISRRIIALHGGEIRAESVINVGTTLTFRLPSAGWIGDEDTEPMGADLSAELTSNQPK